MTLEELIEARLAGFDPWVPPELRRDARAALDAHDRLTFAVGETIGWPAPDDRDVPRLPAGYEVVRELGRGGMGVVYLARQEPLGREVAVKVIRPGHMAEGRRLRRFLEEARHLAQLRHPNIVAVHEVGRADGEHFFSMDYIPGESLADRLGRGALPVSQAVALLKQVAEGVQHAHEHGIIHRDLKPGNVLLDDAGRAYVTDFGLARDLAVGSDLTRPGELLGTPAYMSPEQARGAGATHRRGHRPLRPRRHPLRGPDRPAPLRPRRAGRRLRPPPARGPGPAPPDRPPDSPRPGDDLPDRDGEGPGAPLPDRAALLEDLRRFDEGLPIAARRTGPLTRAARWTRRHWRSTLAAAAAAGLAAWLATAMADRPIAELRDWGREREAAGDLAGAIDVYQRAWQKARGPERDRLRADLVRCIRATADPKVAVGAARRVLREDPDASFGPHDYLVARDLVAELRDRNPGRSIAGADPEDRGLVELAARRLRLFLDSGAGTAEQRHLAGQSLDAVDQARVDREPRPLPAPEPEDAYPLPTGTPDELRSLAGDASRTLWDRGLAGLALARRLEADGDRPAARDAAARAFESLRRAYPLYAGAAESTIITQDRGRRAAVRIGREAPEARLLREADALARRSTPAARPASAAGSACTSGAPRSIPSPRWTWRSSSSTRPTTASTPASGPIAASRSGTGRPSSASPTAPTRSTSRARTSAMPAPMPGGSPACSGSTSIGSPRPSRSPAASSTSTSRPGRWAS